VQALILAAEGRLSELPPLDWDPRCAAVVVLAGHGYPGPLTRPDDPLPPLPHPEPGPSGVGDSEEGPVFHSGTRALGGPGGRLAPSNGRVLCMCGLGRDQAAAAAAAYRAVDRLGWEDGFCRRDIGGGGGDDGGGSAGSAARPRPGGGGGAGAG
jgi:phosphoribosylamine---glycine ligase